MDMLSLRVWLVGPVRNCLTLYPLSGCSGCIVWPMVPVNAGFVLFHGNWVVSGVVPRRRFENGSSGMNIRIRAEEMCCD